MPRVWWGHGAGVCASFSRNMMAFVTKAQPLVTPVNNAAHEAHFDDYFADKQFMD